MKNYKIDKTGNFWVDNGIVGLYKVITDIENDAYCELTASGLEFSFENEKILVDILNKAREEVVTHYLKETGNFGWIYKDAAFEVYKRKDFKMHLKPFFTGKTPKTEGALLVPDAKDNELGGKGKRMTDIEYEAFQKFKDDNIGRMEGNKKLKIEDRGFINSPPAYEIGSDFNLTFFEEGKKTCLFSGKKYKIADVVTGMDFPFLTGKSGELNFSSFLEGKPQLSALYSFVALFSFYNLNYLLQGDMKHYFVLYDGNLESLSEFLNTVIIEIEQLSKSDFCSFETEIIGTVYESEALFNFLLSTYNQLKLHFEEEKYDERKLFTKSVFTLSNDGNIFRDVKEYTSLTDLFNLFEAFAFNDKEQNYFNHFKNFVKHFTQRLDSGKYDTIWRDRLCNEILSFKSIVGSIESYLGEVKIKEEKGSISYLDKILLIYNQKTNNKMNADLVKLCQNIGINIGIYSYAEKDRSCLYSLRNAKSRVEFLKSLELIQFRIMESDKVADQYKTKNYLEFFTNLPDGKDWEEIKSMVSIFSMNSYLFEKQKTTKEESK